MMYIIFFLSPLQRPPSALTSPFLCHLPGIGKNKTFLICQATAIQVAYQTRYEDLGEKPAECKEKTWLLS